MKNKIFLFPISLAVIFFASIIIIFSPVGQKNIINLPTPTPAVNPTKIPSLKKITPTSFVITKQIGYIKNAYYKNNKKFIDIDYVEWLSDNTEPNDYRIKNDNPLIRSFEVINSSTISLIDYTETEMIFPKVSFEEFVNILSDTSPNHYYNFYLSPPPFWITLNSSNQVTEIKEQYVP